jgi:thiol:disulfide interchange protein
MFFISNRFFFLFVFLIHSFLYCEFNSPQTKVTISHTQLPEKEGDFYIVVDFYPQKGWHLYWQNPGDSGMPPKVDFDLPSFAKASFLGFPAPSVQKHSSQTSYVYETPFCLVYQVSTTDAIKLKDIKIDANWLSCKQSCLPQNYTTTLEDKPLIHLKDAQKKVDLLPQDIFQGTIFEKNKRIFFEIHPDDSSLEIIEAYFFPKNQGYIVTDKPQTLQKKDNGKKYHLKVDLLTSKEHIEGLLNIKTKEGLKTYIIDHDLSPEPIDHGDDNFLLMLLFAVLGGLILNLMPCVFPVLSLKILHIMDHSETRKGLLRHGLAYTGGILLAFMTLFLVLTVLKSAGHSVGWGFQLQSPYIIIFLIMVFTVLSLNLLGVFEFKGFDAENSSTMDHSKAYTSFLNGILTTLVATPCTAPFMGTALAVALSQSYLESFSIFTGLSFGLALPFLVLCLYPNGLRFLPKPGLWMKTFKEFLAFPMIGAIVWLLWILESMKPTGIISVLIMLFSVVLTLWIYGKIQYTSNKIITLKIIPLICFFSLFLHCNKSFLWTGLFYGLLAVICLMYLFVFINSIRKNKLFPLLKLLFESLLAFALSISYLPILHTFDTTQETIQAIPYSKDLEEKTLSEGRPVFINYTARWCITCQMNKLNVLSSVTIKDAFSKNNILYMEADWTNHSPEISKSLKEYNRESIPFYVLKIPGQKKPIVLPELLTTNSVLEAFDKLQK